jgi:hypothetical protein
VKRWIVIPVICLLLGAVVNIAVAWGFAYWSLPRFEDVQSFRNGDDPQLERRLSTPALAYAVEQWTGAGIREQLAWLAVGSIHDDAEHAIAVCFADGVTSSLRESYGSCRNCYPEREVSALLHLREELIQINTDRRCEASGPTFLLETEVGWPMRCVSGFAVLGPGSWSRRAGLRDCPQRLVGAIEVTRRIEMVRVPALLPFEPLWPGFAFNTLIWAVFAWVLLFGPLALRRVIRRRRGRCPRCGYELRGELDAGCAECGWNRLAESSESSS